MGRNSQSNKLLGKTILVKHQITLIFSTPRITIIVIVNIKFAVHVKQKLMKLAGFGTKEVMVKHE